MTDEAYRAKCAGFSRTPGYTANELPAGKSSGTCVMVTPKARACKQTPSGFTFTPSHEPFYPACKTANNTADTFPIWEG